MSRVILPKSVPDSLQRMQVREDNHRHWWGELARHAQIGDIKAFYQTYSNYLESQNIISKEHMILHQMAKMVVAELETKAEGSACRTT